MSRYSIKFEKDKEFVYGHDQSLGYFYQIWDHSKGSEDEECIMYENSTAFGRMSNKEMLSLMRQNRANPSHIEMVSKDMPF